MGPQATSCRPCGTGPRGEKLVNRLLCLLLLLACLCPSWLQARDSGGAADLIIHHAKIVTVDEKFHIAEAIAVKDGRIVALGDNRTVLRRRGPKMPPALPDP